MYSIINEFAKRASKNKIGRLSLDKSPRRNQSTRTLQSSDCAKVQQNIEICKKNLKILSKKWKNRNDVYGFLTDLWNSLNMNDNGKGNKRNNSSKYTYFYLPNGVEVAVSVRVSAHNANCVNYLKQPCAFNLGIVIQRKNKPNRFKPHPEVKAEEYVYTNQRIKSVDNPLSQIADSLLKFLETGIYNDTTGVAIKHVSPHPQQTDNNININNTEMKQKIRLNEMQLHKIIKKSVKKVLKERKQHYYFDEAAFEKWENDEKIPSEILDMVQAVGDKIGYPIDCINYVFEIRNRGGYVIGYAKGFSVPVTTSSYLNGPGKNYAKYFQKWLKGLGFSLNDIVRDVSSDHFRNCDVYEFIYDSSYVMEDSFLVWEEDYSYGDDEEDALSEKDW